MITIRTDVECPVKCGNCCMGCKHLSPVGCTVERKYRPFECNAWVCSDGTMVNNGPTKFGTEQWEKEQELFRQSKEFAEEKERFEKAFVEKMMSKMCDGDPDFNKTVDKDFWELI